MTLDAIANHLWQSTICAAVAALIAAALRKNHAAVRFWVWFAASVKFLVPFAALVALGTLVPWKPAPLPTTDTIEIFETVSTPFSQSDVVTVAAQAPPRVDLRAAIIRAIPAVWLVGTLFVALRWAVRWRRVSALARSATPLTRGREHDILRNLEREFPTRPTRPTRLVLSESGLEPGVVGIVRPVLLWPRSLSARLTDAQIESILAHELAHVRRRDNLTAAIHMVVEAVFWFHPLVWWIGARLVDERERACDEQVVRICDAPETYAESILRTCEHHTASPLACVSGVTGSDLKKRIEGIMRGTLRHSLSRTRKAALGVTAVLIVSVPVGLGLLESQPLLSAQTTPSGARLDVATGALAFEVASVKANNSGETQSRFGLPPGRFIVTNAPLREIIRQAYQVSDFQLVNAPAWAASARFDIEARTPAQAGGPPMALGPGGLPPELLAMLRSLLVERFKLAVHAEMREMPVYALVPARRDKALGPAVTSSTIDCAALAAAALANPGAPPKPSRPGQPPKCGMFGVQGRLEGWSANFTELAQMLTQAMGRNVIDQTGLAGSFDFKITFTTEPSGPSLAAALEEQLGLKLESTRAPMDLIVIDHVERPSDNNAVAAPQVVAPSAATPAPSAQEPVSLVKRNVNVSLRSESMSVRDMLRSFGQIAGVEVTYDPDYQDRNYSFQADNITVEDALNRLLLANQLFYRVIDGRTILIIPDTLQKRQRYGQAPSTTYATPGSSPAFGAVSVRENKTPRPERRVGFLQGGRFIADNAPLGMVISAAFADISTGSVDPAFSNGTMFSGTAGGLLGFQMTGAPDWIGSVAYDIEATSTEPEMSGSRMRQMLRALLADRFKMTTRVEKRELPAYRLRPNRRDEQLGGQIKPAVGGCTAPGSKPSDPPVPTCGFRQTFEGTTIRLNAASISMAQLANRLQGFLGMPVTNGTAITGWFDVSDLRFTRPTPTPDAAGQSDLSIFTAIQEQLGLKLEPQRERIDVLVIDHVERPTEN